MKIVELLNNISVPITNEESDILGKFLKTDEISKKEFNSREQHLIDNLVRKDILIRKKNNGQICYRKKS
jgi:hypothetical protein